MSKTHLQPKHAPQLETPIAFIIFNRPETTQRVFDEIKKVKPKKLFVISDGARNEEEEAIVVETRKIIDQIDWSCEVHKNYSDTNLGCKVRVSSGIDWFFENVEQGIILEDDCLPNQSFFWFCKELLERYADDEKVMHISGDFFQQKNKNFNHPESYYFSVVPHIWGWATWRRAWKHYDVNLKDWPRIKEGGEVAQVLNRQEVYDYWSYVWDKYHAGTKNSWDGQWAFACITNNGICINPTVNLVSNIGFGRNATRTKELTWVANLPTQELTFPLVHPLKTDVDRRADAYTFREVFKINKNLFRRMVQPLKTALPGSYQKIKRLLGR